MPELKLIRKGIALVANIACLDNIHIQDFRDRPAHCRMRTRDEEKQICLCFKPLSHSLFRHKIYFHKTHKSTCFVCFDAVSQNPQTLESLFWSVTVSQGVPLNSFFKKHTNTLQASLFFYESCFYLYTVDHKVVCTFTTCTCD